MSGVTGSLDCEECLSSAHGANSTELHLHSTVDEDDELLRYIWREYLYPKQYEWVLIVAYIIVFFVSLVGNSLGEFMSFNLSCVKHPARWSLSNFYLRMSITAFLQGKENKVTQRCGERLTVFLVAHLNLRRATGDILTARLCAATCASKWSWHLQLSELSLVILKCEQCCVRKPVALRLTSQHHVSHLFVFIFTLVLYDWFSHAHTYIDWLIEFRQT